MSLREKRFLDLPAEKIFGVRGSAKNVLFVSSLAIADAITQTQRKSGSYSRESPFVIVCFFKTSRSLFRIVTAITTIQDKSWEEKKKELENGADVLARKRRRLSI